MKRILIFLAALCLGISTSAAQRPPNMLVILVDDLGYGDLGTYGAKDLRTPHLDRLAREGTQWSNFYANCTVCSPTRASLLTGRYPELVGVPGVIRTHAENSWGWLSPGAITLPQALKKAGYDTAIIGKWHLGLESPNTPNERGFDFFHGFLGDMMDDYYKHLRHGINYMRRNGEILTPEGHATDLFSDWTIDYLKQRSKAEKPFFLYLAYNAPHTPIQPPDEWIKKVTDREPGISQKRAKLVALIEHMDEGIGRVLEALKQTGLDKNTLVIFSSDNGGQLDVGGNNGATRDGKGSMYEGGLRVPFIASWPGGIKPGSRSDRVAITMDLFPTLLEAAGAKAQHKIDGLSFLPALRGEAQPPHQRDLFFIRREGGNAYGGETIEAIRRGDWKLLQNSPFKPLELYNLKNDPLETTNLADQEKKVFNELAAALRVQIQRGGAVPWQAPERANAP